jgi:SAM-dependent methyltransferase
LSIADFYDELAGDYHLLFADWDAAVAWQARTLLPLVGGDPILDAAAGMGTQAIGLALAGRQVVARDLSPRLVERGKKEAARLGAQLLAYEVGDLRQLDDEGRFGTVLAVDNAISHLDEDELKTALIGVRRALQPGGRFVASIRDYDTLVKERPPLDPPRVLGQAPRRRIVLQVWTWDDGSSYTLDHLILCEEDGWASRHRRGRYRALLRAELEAAARAAGFTDLGWLEPAQSGFYQPIFSCR